jgi:Tfp pilus assembly protein PilX
MNRLALAKRRAARRRRNGGAVMFIVAMTLAVLASVGVYALAAAATEVRTSGNERQNTQTHYLAEYGVLGAAREMVGSRALFTVKLMKSATYRDTNCVSLQGVPSTAPPAAIACVRMGAQELGAGWALPAAQIPITKYGGNNGSQPYSAGILPGSFGPTPMNGDFFVELTEPMQLSAPARYSTNSNACFAQITATSIGFTQPFFPSAVNALAATYGGEGVETERARLVAGPLIPCPQ